MPDYDDVLVMTAESRYRQLEALRSPYLRRAERAAELTIPSICPKNGHNSTTALPLPWQSLGARGVNNLSSKLTLTMIPPGSPFFRMLPTFQDLDDLKKQNPDAASQFEEGLGKYERAVGTEIETSNDRPAAHEAFKHLVVTGNVLWVDLKDGAKFIPLRNYVVKRDPAGNVLEILVKETVDPMVLPAAVREMLPSCENSDGHKSIDLFTWVKRQDNRFLVHQEISGKQVPDSDGNWPIDAPAYLPLRFNRIDGEDYGRGYVEEHLGDLISFDELSRALTEGSAAAARMLVLVDPNGTTRLDTVASAPNGAVRPGRADDVTVVQSEKFHDFSTAERRMVALQKDLESVFLLNSSVQRNGERVTAEEIRFMAQELESQMGGLYTILASEFQLPYVKRKIAKMERKGELPMLPKKLVRVAIITGLDALGRGNDLQKLDVFIKGAQQDIGPDQVAQYINVANYFRFRATALGLDKESLIRSEDEVAAERQQQMQAQQVQQLAPEVIKQVGNHLNKQQGATNNGG